eukprot:TRINITY_DN42_c0_g1_i2.p1 TRINITY_DN42_c0_g1~~TRINITY_DN42_c0_g1_i2.p1  ORF type:complete len:177 (+),score=38.27 TRINITY_DN42_c0_g1_i2:129-659(+)
MAAIAAASAVIAPASLQTAVTSKKAFNGLKAGGSLFAGKNEWAAKTVSNSSRVSCMKVWTPIDNPKFETLSYLPPLSANQISRQIDYILRNNWIPCLEFDLGGVIYREHNAGPCYYDGRYWTMWKLPFFGATGPSQILQEIELAKKEYPDCYIRILGFDNIKQVQSAGFVVHKPGF